MGYTLKCATTQDVNYSRYTVTKSVLSSGIETNGNLKYPIGLLSDDEVTFSGGYKYHSNDKYYLYNSSITTFFWWLLSPDHYQDSHAIELSVVGSHGGINNDYVNSAHVFRPTINLKKDIKFTGTGTSTDPYKIVIE